MAVRETNAALTYIRRSGERQEISLGEQVTWAMKEADRFGVTLDASHRDLHYMQTRRLHSYKSIRLDDAVTGADLERRGLLAFIDDLLADPSLSHGFSLRRDRLARPEEAAEMILREKQLSRAGITLVFSDKVIKPLALGEEDFARDLATFFDYYESGKFLRTLAENVILAQRRLANDGYTTGGDPPYGHVRALFESGGKLLEYLPRGRKVRQAGCHVRWVPGPSEEDQAKLAIWIHILDLKHQGWGLKRIANHLNHMGIPSPGAGRVRTDHGVRHEVSGRWGHNAVAGLCRNKTILGLKEHGRRSEGKHRRLGEDGWRYLTEDDLNDRGKPKFVNNPEASIVEAPSGGPAQYDAGKWQQVQDQISERSTNQKGVSRSRDPAKYPLSCRVVDMTDGCGAIMYGTVQSKRPLYKCGRYMRTAGDECNNNAVDAEALLQFVLHTIGHVVNRPGRREKLRDALWKIAKRTAETSDDNEWENRLASLDQQIEDCQRAITRTKRRLTREEDEIVYEALRGEYLALKKGLAKSELNRKNLLESQTHKSSCEAADEVQAALGLLDNLSSLVADDSVRTELPPMFESLGIKVGLNFVEAIKGRKRRVRKLASGVVAFGDNELPVKLHGNTRIDPAKGNESLVGRGERESVETGENSSDSTDARPGSCHREGISFTKVSRGDWI